MYRELENMVRRFTSQFHGDIVVEEFTNAPTADPDAFIATIASTVGIQTFDTAAEFDGVVGLGVLAYPRNVTLTLSSHADWDATVAVVTGLDVFGRTMAENLSIPNAGNATVVGVKAFKSLTSLVIPAQSGAGGTADLGFGAKFGLSKPVRSRAGRAMVTAQYELTAGLVTNGVFVLPATGAPCGTYAPNLPPDAAEDYAIAYEMDVAAYLAIVRPPPT